MENIEIQTLLPSEWSEYKQLRLRALKTEPQAFLSSFEKESAYTNKKWQQRLRDVGDGKNWIFFARNSDGRLVGYIGGYRDDNDLKNHSAQIWGAYVDQNMRGKGIAKTLISRIIKELESDPDINFILLEVNIDQESAKKLYESFGFKSISTYSYILGDNKEHQILKMEKVKKSNRF